MFKLVCSKLSGVTLFLKTKNLKIRKSEGKLKIIQIFCWTFQSSSFSNLFQDSDGELHHLHFVIENILQLCNGKIQICFIKLV